MMHNERQATKVQLTNRGIKPKGIDIRELAITLSSCQSKFCVRQGRVAKDRRVKPKGEMTIPITRYRDA